jgi:arylsulfatase A-like enzyme
MISNIDVLPTLLELLEIPTPESIQGRSFCPLLMGNPYQPRREIFGEITYHDYYDPRRAIRTETHKLILNFSAAPFFMDPSQSWRPRSDTVFPLNHAFAYHPHVELYDLQTDPWELNNLAESASHAEIRQELMTRLKENLIATSDPILKGAVTSPMHRKVLEILERNETNK